MTELTEHLAHDLVQLDQRIRDERRWGNRYSVWHLERQRDLLVAKRSQLLRNEWAQVSA